MDNAASDDEVSDAGNDHTRMLLAIWILLFCFFLSLPFCSNAKRRQLWRQRVRERRWVMDDDEDDWYRQLVERRRSERRQELEAEQLRFQTTKTQEDDIREQYLLLLLEKHSLTLSTSDIHQLSEKLVRSSSQGSMGVSDKETVATSVTDLTALPSSAPPNKEYDIEAPTPASPIARSGSVISDDDDDGDALQEMNFEGIDTVVCVPCPGGTNREEQDGTKRRLRQVPNGCPICLGHFVADEKISWSSNGDCRHVFHHDCLMHWFHAVGRRVRKRQLSLRPELDEAESLDLLCKFPKLCPCCRQSFCVEGGEEEETKTVAEDHDEEEPTGTMTTTTIGGAEETSVVEEMATE